MKKVSIFLALAVMTSPVLAGTAPAVPEMDAGAGIGALALVIGAAAIIREKFFRK